MVEMDSPGITVDGLVAVGRFDDLESAREYALVVLAMNLDCLITVHEGGYVIHGEEAFQEAIREEFRLYTEEQKTVPDDPAIPVFSSGINLALIWICAVLFCFGYQMENPGVEDRFLSSSIAIWEDGEYYRALTSLFLHADLEHAMGNVLFGTLFGVFVANSFGPLKGWGLVLASGFLGNLASMAIRYPDQALALGASTAVFGALGLLVGAGLQEVWRTRSLRRGLRTLGPFLAGLMIFSLNGIGDPGTDTLAHLTGMACGIILGLPVAFFLGRRLRSI
jgi:membrane associated rhomboid family serine protease